MPSGGWRIAESVAIPVRSSCDTICKKIFHEATFVVTNSQCCRRHRNVMAGAHWRGRDARHQGSRRFLLRPDPVPAGSDGDLRGRRAARRSEGLARSFWRLNAAAYCLWLVAQGLSVYNDMAASPSVSWVNNLLFFFWFVPLAMAMFLDPEHEAGKLDALIALDFVQAVLVCVAAYLYFFYSAEGGLPANWRTRSGRPTSPATLLWPELSWCAPP